MCNDNETLTKEEANTLRGLLKKASDALFDLTQDLSDSSDEDDEGNRLTVIRTSPETFSKAMGILKNLENATSGMQKSGKRLGRVRLEFSYVADLDNENMVNHAADAVYDDIIAAVHSGGRDICAEIVEDPTLSEGDIPSFLLDEENMEEATVEG